MINAIKLDDYTMLELWEDNIILLNQVLNDNGLTKINGMNNKKCCIMITRIE